MSRVGQCGRPARFKRRYVLMQACFLYCNLLLMRDCAERRVNVNQRFGGPSYCFMQRDWLGCCCSMCPWRAAPASVIWRSDRMRDYADADRDFGGYAIHAAAGHGDGKAGVELVMLMMPLAMMILLALLVATMTTTIKMSMPLALMFPLLMGEQRLRLTWCMWRRWPTRSRARAL